MLGFFGGASRVWVSSIGYHLQFAGAQHGTRHRFTHQNVQMSAPSDLLVRCLDKVNQKYYPKWWFDGDLPWSKVKENTLNESKHQWPKPLQKSHDLRGKKYIYRSPIPWNPGLDTRDSVWQSRKKKNSIKSDPPNKLTSKNGSTEVPSLKPSLFSFWQQKATQKTTGSRSSFSSSLRRKGRSRSKSRPRWKWAKPRCEKKMGHYLEDGLPGRTLQWLGITKGNLERGTTLLRGLIKSYQPWSLTTC